MRPYRLRQRRKRDDRPRNVHVLRLSNGRRVQRLAADPRITNLRHTEGQIAIRHVDQLIHLHRRRKVLVAAGKVRCVSLQLLLTPTYRFYGVIRCDLHDRVLLNRHVLSVHQVSSTNLRSLRIQHHRYLHG